MNRKLIISLSTIAAIAIIVIGASTAYFSNTEKSEGNTFIAGAIDLKVDNTCHYNDKVCECSELGVCLWEGTQESCTCTWGLKDLKGAAIFSFLDVKPGDSGEDTISLHVDSNPAWVCAEISNVQNLENGCNPPELKAEKTAYGEENATCGDEGEGEGELHENLLFDVWMDPNCNNIYDNDETYIIQGAKVTDVIWPIADSTTGSPITNACIGVAWSVSSEIGNIIQGDSVKGDITFKAYQSRNNMSFKCIEGDGCFDQADVMLVLDRSASIDSGERTQLKDAAKAFVTAMNPDGGVHMGQTSFADTGSLDLHLTGDATAINNAIDTLAGGTYTNLYEGILLADQELDGTASGSGERESVPDYMVIITDGQPNRPDCSGSASCAAARNAAASAASTAKGKGVSIYVVGVGGDVDSNYLKNQIATSPAHYFGIGDYDGLETILLAIANCQTPDLPPVPETVFSDDFNDGNDAGWTRGCFEDTYGGCSTSNDISILSGSDAYEGGPSLRMKDDAGVYRTISTVGYENINLAYCRRTQALSTYYLDYFRIGWKTDGGSLTWSNYNELEVISSNVGWSCVNFDLPASADNTSITIGAYLDNDNEDYGWWDNIVITGTPQP